jgi:hypothetical protein
MKTKTLLLCTFVILSFINTYSQVDSFDLSKYKVADYKRQSLDFNLQTSAYGNNSTRKTDSYTQKNYQNEINAYLNANYSYILNNRKNQKTLYLSTQIVPYNYDYAENNNASYYQKNQSNDSKLNLYLNYENRYYQTNDLFYKIGVRCDNSITYSKNRYQSYDGNAYTDETNKTSVLNAANAVEFGIGKGRIESIEDARLAVFILEDLLKINSITRKPTEEEIIQLASTITKLKNRRYFDTRLRRIYEIQALDTFLRNTNLVSKSDAVYFTTLNDNWMYSNNPSRTSGKRFSINLRPSFSYDENNNTADNPEMTFSKNLGLKFYGEYYNTKPISLKWQRLYTFQLGYQKGKNWMNSIYNNNYTSDVANITARIELGYYPNSRSYFTAVFNNNLSKYWFDGNSSGSSDLQYSMNLGFSAYYYLSEQLNLNVNAGVSYNYWDYPEYYYVNNDNSLSPSFSLSLSYALF